jgi:hypothetical protein
MQVQASAMAHRWAYVSPVLEDAPLVLFENGHVHDDRVADEDPARRRARDGAHG